jgi:hypothetical protein
MTLGQRHFVVSWLPVLVEATEVLPLFRYGTLSRSLAFVDESGRLFQSALGTYLQIVEGGSDPAAPEAWDEQLL